jgi:hypothetical protein
MRELLLILSVSALGVLLLPQLLLAIMLAALLRLRMQLVLLMPTQLLLRLIGFYLPRMN